MSSATAPHSMSVPSRRYPCWPISSPPRHSSRQPLLPLLLALPTPVSAAATLTTAGVANGFIRFGSPGVLAGLANDGSKEDFEKLIEPAGSEGALANGFDRDGEGPVSGRPVVAVRVTTSMLACLFSLMLTSTPGLPPLCSHGDVADRSSDLAGYRRKAARRHQNRRARRALSPPRQSAQSMTWLFYNQYPR